MMSLLLLAVVTGLDNLAVTAGLGLLRWESRQRRVLLAAFITLEGLMPVLGLGLGLGLRANWASAAEWVTPVCLALAAIAAGTGAWLGREPKPAFRSPIALVLFALALSLDNLFAGVGVGAGGTSGFLSALMLGGVAALLSVLGFTLGELVRERLPSAVSRWGGPGFLLFLAFAARIIDRA